MREIKFRGKRKDNGEWVYGDLQHHWDGVQCRISDYGGGNPVDPSTVGQYTGLKDKHGKEIYEGDIVRQAYEFKDEFGGIAGYHVGPVVLIGSKGACMKRPWNYPTEESGTEAWRLSSYKPVVRYRCEVIGNVWDNPDLLKGGGKDG